MKAWLAMANEPIELKGKQSIKSLESGGSTLENIEISGDNIGLFKQVARKHDIDFALKKDKSSDPPKGNCTMYN